MCILIMIIWFLACKWHGWWKDFFGFEIFDSRIFWVGKFGKYFFGWLDLNRGFFWVLKTNLSALLRPWRIYGMMNKQTQAFNFLWFSLCYIIAPPGNLGVICQAVFWGVILVQDFFLGNAGRLRDFFRVLSFASIQSSSSFTSRSTPLGLCVNLLHQE